MEAVPASYRRRSANHERANTSPARVTDLRQLVRVASRTIELLLFGAMPMALTVGVLAISFGGHNFLYDFRGDLYDAARAILHGHDPYQLGFLAHEAAVKRAGGAPSLVFAVPVYPAPSLLAAVPLAVLPYRLAAVAFALILISSLGLGLFLLGVRDWRCFGATFLAYPVLHGLTLGAIDALLVLAAAAVWRWRDHVWRPAIALVVVVIAKLFAWPLALWMLFTRRGRVLGLAALLALGTILAAWEVVGFSTILEYPRMLMNLTSVLRGSGASLTDGLRAFGLTPMVANVTTMTATAGLLGAARLLAQRPSGEHRAFGLAVVASLMASPVLWPHYFALLIVPIALLSPTLSPLWLVPLLAYAAPTELLHGDLERLVPYLAMEAIIVTVLLRRPSSDSPPVEVMPLTYGIGIGS